MASLTDWIDRGQQERDALQAIIDDRGSTVDLIRRHGQPATTGFDREVNDGELLRTILVRFDPLSTGVIGLTTDTDVQEDDLLRWTDVSNSTRWFRVTQVQRQQASSSLVVEEILR